MNNGNFAIALTVGLKNQFTTPARKLELEIERLERELEQLQRTAGDTQGLASLERETNQLENEMRHTSRATSHPINQPKGTIWDAVQKWICMGCLSV
ncbi:hypothetical protein C3737_16305 [Aeromonas jandaei]|uniref:hypothetical protein n=1 Tax=Aeromonas jandaei TaxID=650 RepID=UPI000D4C575D|nr:hypothetical protein [Aeromonas jandaei]PPA28944.1 hypothetical protein C3737_16305 [Aeromonas jandaei]